MSDLSQADVEAIMDIVFAADAALGHDGRCDDRSDVEAFLASVSVEQVNALFRVVMTRAGYVGRLVDVQ